jgi:ubiquinone/menaquinone biosynthesis C-methylase UbiE
MSDGQVHYRGLVAEYWDIQRGDTSKWSSRAFFPELIRRSGQPALDVACGTGRLLIDYLKEGIDIDGVDISHEMVDIASRNASSEGLAAQLYVQPSRHLTSPDGTGQSSCHRRRSCT